MGYEKGSKILIWHHGWPGVQITMEETPKYHSPEGLEKRKKEKLSLRVKSLISAEGYPINVNISISNIDILSHEIVGSNEQTSSNGD